MLAEEEGHHPDILISYNKVRIDLTAHAISGLSENDFIMATKIDNIPFHSLLGIQRGKTPIVLS
ncbi:hypothetical protein A2757_01015 [Candidatus Giovannonibacteria bacterium RIFCSPHIGHO2_01_FULL_48_47]|nr:MAG: hypothetical protein A2757_01015 [Candidatus Giovannonibacteria bacterium RIFCSPHIGHO2_01_FULL_48_47]OGF67779.1 MAG: hypothetical protein A3D61_02875 [Candidatus Giovannonibacteria bacterium RIFCSPHIGHO2_02_FULL_48_15]OGF88421.1 MAG: hypothetical protein A3B26_01715 [Candidatus Giovannonibacteria bacterium RIFCSPLOWO2_01_FULL_48_47]OGF94712.1 MAG: hypothetical protein A2433_03625 [Candidatus Giovannonibacteria bacterium RIFOXYC1_FULL_48_8]OGF96262.1 MAG: hypothetical protein A2613_01695